LSHILVTGGAGFIGSHLVEELVARGHQVRVLDNFSTGKRSNLESVADQIELIEGDLRVPADLNKALREIEIVFHEAAFVSVPQSLEQPEECFAINVQGVIDLLSAAKDAGVRRVVLASSAAVYGVQSPTPLHEGLPSELLSPYAGLQTFQ
jgi:UDP-glucose 4-epimerase